MTVTVRAGPPISKPSAPWPTDGSASCTAACATEPATTSSPPGLHPNNALLDTHRPWAPLCVIPEGAGTVNPYEQDRQGVVCRSLCNRRAAVSPLTRSGWSARSAARTNDLGAVGGLTQDGGEEGAVAGVAGPPSGGRSRGGSSIASNRWPWAARGLGCRSSLRRAGRHGAVRPQPGGLNQTGDHAAGRGS